MAQVKDNKFNFGYILKVFIRSFLFAILIFLLALIIIGFIYLGDLLYNVKTGGENTPLFGAYVIVTESMIPTINVNDAVIVKRIDDGNVNVGDIITFSAKSGYYAGLSITHRIVGKQLTSTGDFVYRTKGDNNDKEDMALVDENSIYGKVVLKIPKIGYVQKFVLSPTGFVISIVVPVLLVILYEVFRIFILYRRRNKEIEII